MFHRILKNQTLIQHHRCKQRQAGNILSDDPNAIHVQQLTIRASCVYPLYGFLSALNL